MAQAILLPSRHIYRICRPVYIFNTDFLPIGNKSFHRDQKVPFHDPHRQLAVHPHHTETLKSSRPITTYRTAAPRTTA